MVGPNTEVLLFQGGIKQVLSVRMSVYEPGQESLLDEASQALA